MNKIKYILINETNNPKDDSVIGMVWESDKYGRTLVLYRHLDINFPIRIFDNEKQLFIEDIDIINFFWEMLPV